MTYPPEWRRNTSPEAAYQLMREHPFANFITAYSGIRSSRIPFVTDIEHGEPIQLRGHLSGQNPQTVDLDGKDVLVTFSGHSSYVSPHWRRNLDRAGTVDYEEVQVRGTVRLVNDLEFFISLINDLAKEFEAKYSEVGNYPVWETSMAPEGYVERLFPAIRAFEVKIDSVEMVSKLHQSFSEDDRRSIADHLDRADKEDARAIAVKIRRTLL